MAEERISELEVISVETSQREKQRENIYTGKEVYQGLWDNYKKYTYDGDTGRKRNSKEQKKYLKR